MSLVYAAEQRDFAEMVGKVLDAARGEATETDVDPGAAWPQVENQVGFLSTAVPEALGGAGGTWMDVAAAVERVGENPIVGGVPTALAGVAALLACNNQDGAGILREVMLGECFVVPSWLATDRVWVPDAGGMLVTASERLDPAMFDQSLRDAHIGIPGDIPVRFLLPACAGGGLEIWISDPMPPGRDEHAVGLLDQPVVVVDVPRDRVAARPIAHGSATRVVNRARAIAHAMSAVEAVGSSSWLLRASVDYLKLREQFGMVLGSAQGLKFAAADLFRQIEPLRSLAYAAVEAAEADGDDAGAHEELVELACAAKVVADDVHAKVALEAIQLHGGIGFTWELGLHNHLKRAVSNRPVAGDDRARRRQLADRIQRRSSALGRVASAASDHSELRQEVRDWLALNAKHAPPPHGAHEPMHYNESARELDWRDRVREGRWLCLSWPEEYGGRALTELEVIAVNEEFAAAGAPRPLLGMGETLLAPAILANGTDEQRERLLPRILSGEDVYCQGFSEPDHGTDLAHLETRGVTDGDQVIVNGAKIWQSGAHRANRIFLLCRTDPEAAAHRGLSYCLADMKDNGVTVRPLRMISGDYGFNQVQFDDTRVDLRDVIGGLNNGWKVAMTTLGAERAGAVTSQHLGYAAELDLLVDALEDSGRLDAAAAELVPLWLDVLQMKCNGRRVAELLKLGAEADDLLSIDKLNWSEYHVRFGLAAAQLLGERGVLRPPGPNYQLNVLQRVLLESPGRRIARGTNQIQRRIISERRLGMPR